MRSLSISPNPVHATAGMHWLRCYGRISLILTSFVAVLMASNYVWEQLADRLQRRKPGLIGGLALITLGYYLLSQAPNADWAWAARLLEVVGYAGFTTLSLATMADLLSSQERRGRRMGTFRGLGSLAFAGGALIGALLADRSSLPLTFAVCVGLLLLAALAILGRRELRQSSPTDPLPTAEPRLHASRPARILPWLFLAGVFCWMTAHSASTSMWPNFMAQLSYSKTAIGSLWGLAALVEMPTMVLSGMLSELIGRAPLLAAGGLGIAGVPLGYIAAATLLPALIGIQILRGCGFGTYATTAMTFTAESGANTSRGRRSGLFYTAGSLGQLLGMFLGGTLAQLSGFTTLFGICALFALLSSVCFWALGQRRGAAATQKASV